MAQTTITKVSTKGQVVIPKELRKELGIKEADELFVYGEKDTIIMKKIAKPAIEKRFKELADKLSKEVKARGITRKDLEEAIKAVRRKQ